MLPLEPCVIISPWSTGKALVRLSICERVEVDKDRFRSRASTLR